MADNETRSHDHDEHLDHSHDEPAASGPTTVKDPVCGMTVDPATSRFRATYHGRVFHFCSAKCRGKFLAAPEGYSGEARDAAPVARAIRAGGLPEGTIYTCPMHPEIRSPEPGTCPICGMALEPEVPTPDNDPSGELRDMTRRFWFGLALTIPVFILEMGSHLLNIHVFTSQQTSNWIQLVLATPVVLWADGHSSSAAGPRWSPAISTCSP